MKEDEQIVKAEVLSKQRAETLAKRKELTAKYLPFAIDNVAAKAYFEKYREAINSEGEFWESIEAMADVILAEYETS